MRQLCTGPGVLAVTLALALTACGSDDGGDGGKDTATATDTTGGDVSDGHVDHDSQADGMGDGTMSDGGGDGGSDAMGDGTGAKKYNKCVDLGDCVMAACGPKGFATGCQDACLADSGEPTLLKGIPLLTCVKDVCLPACKDSKEADCLSECMPQKCGEHMMACLADQIAPKGGKVCGEVLPCFDGCDKPGTAKPFSCYQGCLESTDAAGVQQLGAMMMCMAKEGEAAEEKCIGPMIACLSGGKTGDGKCHEFFGCQEACQKGGKPEEACMGECAGKLSKGAQASFIDAAPCFEKQQDPVCAGKVMKCINPSGTANCLDSMACVEKCGKEGPPACMFECLHKATAAGAGQILAIAKECKSDEPVDGPGDPTPTTTPPTPECIKAMTTCAVNPASTGTCVDLVACSKACDDKGPSCGLMCISKAKPSDVDAFLELGGCKAKCDDQCKADAKPEECSGKCMMETCAATVGKCSPPK